MAHGGLLTNVVPASDRLHALLLALSLLLTLLLLLTTSVESTAEKCVE